MNVRGLILACCCVAQFTAMLDTSIVNVALPAIRADLGFSSDALLWVVDAYTLACAGFLLLGGRAADLIGRRRVFLCGLVLFGIASMVGGLARAPVTLVAARAAQGLAGAVVAPTSLSILATVFREGAERNRAFGWWGTLGGLGGISGALIGGVLTEALSWRAVLLVNAPLVLGVAALGARVLPPLAARAAPRRTFDAAGALTVTGGLVLLAYGIVSTHRSGWGSATLGPIAAGGCLLCAFVVVEARWAVAPLLPLRVLRSRAVSGAGVVAFCLGGAAFSMWFFVSLYVQQVLGFSALQAGLVFAPMSLTIIACTQAASRLAARVGSGVVLTAGMTLLATGMVLFARLGPDGSWVPDVLTPSLLCAAGVGCSFVCTTITANAGVSARDSGLASGLVNAAFQVGGSVGLAVLATLAAARTDAAGGYARAFGGAGALALAGAAVAFVVLAAARYATPGSQRGSNSASTSPGTSA